MIWVGNVSVSPVIFSIPASLLGCLFTHSQLLHNPLAVSSLAFSHSHSHPLRRLLSGCPPVQFQSPRHILPVHPQFISTFSVQLSRGVYLHIPTSSLTLSQFLIPTPSLAATLFSITSFFATTSSTLHALPVYCTVSFIGFFVTLCVSTPPACRQSTFANYC
ncbi:hypothetical protein DL98DRAFT_41427 [Cadophora sp. DSE1049]|nr:hypothetical protein DL98DRAFT_41427 [Cadophora sp. DSE1049]